MADEVRMETLAQQATLSAHAAVSATARRAKTHRTYSRPMASAISVALLLAAVVMAALAARIYLGRWSTYLPPNARRSAFAFEASGALVFAAGLVLEALGLHEDNPYLGFVGSLVEDKRNPDD